MGADRSVGLFSAVFSRQKMLNVLVRLMNVSGDIT